MSSRRNLGFHAKKASHLLKKLAMKTWLKAHGDVQRRLNVRYGYSFSKKSVQKVIV